MAANEPLRIALRFSEERKANEFLSQHSLEMDVYFVDAKPAPWAKGVKSGSGYRYRVVIRPRGYKADAKSEGVDDFEALCFDYWDCAHNREVKQPPNKWDVIETLAAEIAIPSTFKDFCSEFSYSPDSIDAQKTYERCQEFASEAIRILKPKVIEALQAIKYEDEA